MMYSPIEQFEIFQFFPTIWSSILGLTDFNRMISGYVIWQTNFSLMFFFWILMLFSLHKFNYFKFYKEIYYLNFIMFESFLNFFKKQEISIYEIKYLMPLMGMMLFILMNNLLGMTPYGFSLTSHLNITFTLAFSFFLTMNLLAIQKHKWKFFQLFLPSGSPLMMAPFLSMIELISYMASVFSLSMSLFANVISSHILLKILVKFFMLYLFVIGMNILFVIGLHFLLVLELGICMLQAYIFLTLCTIYLKELNL